MINKSKYLRTDMASESIDGLELESGVRGVRFFEQIKNGIAVSTLEITSAEGEKIIGKGIGKYITVGVGRIWLCDASTREKTVRTLSSELLDLSRGLCKDPETVLVVGLGNMYITSDSIGPRAIEGLNVTRHIKYIDRRIFDSLSSHSLAAFAPGVVGQTGIESVELIKGAVDAVAPSLVIAIDALAAKSVDRLAVTVQLSNRGITPGSGIGNQRKAIDKDTLGVPVISVGVPTVVDSSTLILSAFEQAGIEEIPEQMESVLENGRSFFVTLKDTDTASIELARLISDAINLSFSYPL